MTETVACRFVGRGHISVLTDPSAKRGVFPLEMGLYSHTGMLGSCAGYIIMKGLAYERNPLVNHFCADEEIIGIFLLLLL